MWDECNCVVVWTFFGIALFLELEWQLTFPVCSHSWVFQICWHIECSTFTASPFRIWNSSAGIPSPPLALFILLLPKAHLTSHSRMSGSMWYFLKTMWRWNWIIHRGLSTEWEFCKGWWWSNWLLSTMPTSPEGLSSNQYLKHFLHAFFFVIIFRVLDYYPLHFTDETTEAQEGSGTHPWPHS